MRIDGHNHCGVELYRSMRAEYPYAQDLKALKGDHDFYGLKIQPFMLRSPILSLLTEGKAFFEFARTHDLPFLIHSRIGPQRSFPTPEAPC